MANKQNLGDLFTSNSSFTSNVNISVGNSSINTSINSTSIYVNGVDAVIKIYDSSNTQVFP